MNIMQIASLCALAVLAAYMYAPPLSFLLPASKPPKLLSQIEDIVAIRDSYRTPEITQACNALLSVLLKVMQ